MAIHDKTLDQSTVLDVVEQARVALESESGDIRLSTCDALGIGSDEWTACRAELVEQLQDAQDWVEKEEVLRTVDDAPVDSDDGPDFVPANQTLALVQSAMEEELDRGPHRRFFPRDPKWLSVLYQRLRSRARGKAPFLQHEHAAAVAQQISARNPDHVVHLGDVYYSGTPREVQRNFLDMWRSYGPPHARYWALNANHDMYSGGYGYFQHVLPAFGQPASYFNLQNAHWRLIGLDSGYVNHNLNAPQIEWLGDQFGGTAKTILMTHHHLFSPFRKRGDVLEERLDPFLADGRFFGWFWGHDHHLIEYTDYRGVKCRCIGHGSIPYVPPDRRRVRHEVDIVRMETRPTPVSPSRGMHGFALLTFDGPALHIEYVDEDGGTAWTERWD